MSNYKHIVICGGSGKRLWPLSRENYPKPYLKFNDNYSLFQQTLLRHNNCSEHIIVTNNQLYYQSLYQEGELNLPNPTSYLLESIGKNTGPAVLLACLATNPDDILVVTPADHAISPVKGYEQTINQACQLAKASDNIVLIGITPTYPATEYGYILTNGQNVTAFKEKPNETTANQYISNGNAKWNSGIFCFKSSVVLDCFKTIAPDLYHAVITAYHNRNELNTVQLNAIEPMSFDQGILEKTNNINVIPNNFDWNDCGCFDDINSVINKNNPDDITINATNTFSYSESNKQVAFHDVNDIYLIESNDAILVGKKGQSKHVSSVVSELSKTNGSKLKHSNIVYRPWGYYMVLHEMDNYKAKKIVVYPKKRLSLQTHQHRSEHWTCVEGTITVVNDNNSTKLSPNKSIYIPKGNKHRLENNSNELAIIFEIQYGEYLGEDDIIRIESDY